MAEVLANFYYGATVVLALALAFVSAVAYGRRRELPALVVAFLAVGVAVWIAREQHWPVPFIILAPMRWLAGVLVLLGLIITANSESHR